MLDPHLLDNPIWNSLITEHSRFALGDNLARRFPADIGPLSGFAEPSDAAYDTLRTLAGPAGIVVLFLEEPPAPHTGWSLIRGGLLTQMLCPDASRIDPVLHSTHAELRRLTAADVPQMVALAELTEPGPFRTRTHELGLFFGIFESDRLVSMAGQRTRVPGFIEVSAVCTHPDARGRGYARTLMSAVMDDIFAQGSLPFLHAFADNHAAIRVYQSLGFSQRRTFHLAVLKNEQ
jgi:GNAT superfamily N-acetyltransferase